MNISIYGKLIIEIYIPENMGFIKNLESVHGNEVSNEK